MYRMIVPFLILLPMKYEIKILIHFLRQRQDHGGSISAIVKIILRSLFYYLARVKLYFKYYSKRKKLLLPECFATKKNAL